MQTIVGTIQRIANKQLANGGRSWAVKLDNSEKWISTFVNNSNKKMLYDCEQGNVVEVQYEPNAKGYLNLLSIKSSNEAPTAASTATRGFVAGGARGGWGPEKERSIVLQSCLKIASHLVSSALAKDMLPTPGTRKNDKWESIIDITVDTAVRLAAQVEDISKKPFKTEEEKPAPKHENAAENPDTPETEEEGW